MTFIKWKQKGYLDLDNITTLMFVEPPVMNEFTANGLQDQSLHRFMTGACNNLLIIVCLFFTCINMSRINIIICICVPKVFSGHYFNKKSSILLACSRIFNSLWSESLLFLSIMFRLVCSSAFLVWLTSDDL